MAVGQEKGGLKPYVYLHFWGYNLMYLLYEHHKDASGAILATDMLLSSRYPGSTYINFKNVAEQAVFLFAKETFKEINAKERTYDDKTNIWSFFGNAGKTVYNRLKASAIVSVGLKFERVENLAAQKASGYIHAPVQNLFDAADFFYEQAAPTSSGPSKEELRSKLAAMLAVPEQELDTTPVAVLKKPYRQAALRLHPDRNNGDGSRMSELNYLWQQWQPYAAQ